MYVTTHMDVKPLSNLVTEDGIYLTSSTPNLKRIGFLQAKLFNFKVVKLKKNTLYLSLAVFFAQKPLISGILHGNTNKLRYLLLSLGDG